VSDVPTLLGVEPRYARRVVASLRACDRVVVDDDGDGRRVWLPDRRRRWLSDRRYVAHLLASFGHQPKPPQRYCGNCGAPIKG